MGLTSFLHKQTPHFTSVVVLGISAFCGPAFIVFAVECKSIAKDKTMDPKNIWFEFGGAFGMSMGAGFNGLFLWMNQSWAKHQAVKEEDRKLILETKMENRTRGVDPEGHLK